MVAWFSELNPVVQALVATLFTWFLTALGAGLVFFFKHINRKVLDGMLGFAAGVMIAASYWSLLAPAIEMAEDGNLPAWVPATAGFLMGGCFLWIIDKILPHLHLGFPMEEAEGIKTSWHRSVLLVLAITLHNIPEGLAVGVAFGALASDLPAASMAGAFAAGAMIYVVVEELIPESQLEKNTDIATMGAMVGFAVMMTLDVALG
jgi:ZIP family zinc transporter